MGCSSEQLGTTIACGARVGNEGYYVAPAGASQTRVQGILPAKGSEDVSYLLGSITSHVERSREEGERDYLPDIATDWVIDVRFAGDPRLDPKRVSDLFGADWRKLHGGLTIFALNPDTGHWTFLISADGPKEVTRLKMAWDFMDSTGDGAELPSPQVFSARDAAVREAVRPLGMAELRVSLSPDEAARRAHWLDGFKARLDYSPSVILRAPRGKKFDGRDIWDVMLGSGPSGRHGCSTGRTPEGSGTTISSAFGPRRRPATSSPRKYQPGRSGLMIWYLVSQPPGAQNQARFSRRWSVRSSTPGSGSAGPFSTRKAVSRASTRSDRRFGPSSTN